MEVIFKEKVYYRIFHCCTGTSGVNMSNQTGHENRQNLYWSCPSHGKTRINEFPVFKRFMPGYSMS